MTLLRCLALVDEAIHHAFFGAAIGAVLGVIVAYTVDYPAPTLLSLLLTASAVWSGKTLSMK